MILKKNLPVFFRWSFQEESKSIYGQKAIYFQESQYHVYYSRFDLDGTFDPGYSVIQKNPSYESDFYDSSRYSPRIQWRKGNSIIELKGHQAGVAILDIQDKYIVSGGINGMVLIHDKNTGNIVAKLKGDESEVIAVSEISGDNHVLVASMDGVIREWGLNGKLYHELRQNREKIKAVSFSPSGKYIVAVSLNQTYLWEKSGQLTSVLKGTSPQVNPMVNEVLPELNSMESQVLTRSSHGTVHLWAISGQLLATFQSPRVKILDAVFSPTDNQVVLFLADGSVQKHPIETLPQMLQRGCTWLRTYLDANPTELDQLPICKAQFAQKP